MRGLLICLIPGISANYGIWFDRINGKTMVSGVDNKKTVHNALDEAKVV